MHTVHGNTFFMEFYMDQSLVHLFSISYFISWKTSQWPVPLATPYSANKTNYLVIKEIEHFSEVLFKWFAFNYMKINCGESHILSSGNDNVSANIDDNSIISENKNELLDITLDSKLSFKDHINNLCEKTLWKHLYYLNLGIVP